MSNRRIIYFALLGILVLAYVFARRWQPTSRPAITEADIVVFLMVAATFLAPFVLFDPQTTDKVSDTVLAERFSNLNGLGQAITVSLDLDTVLKQVLDKVTTLIGAEGVAVLLPDNEDKLCFAAVSGPGASGLQGICMPATEGVAGRVLQTGEPNAVFGPEDQDKIYRSASGESNYSTQSLLAVPLKASGRVIGVLEAAHSQPKAFSTEDLLFLQDAAIWVTVAIENAKLYRQAQNEIKERKQIEEALRRSEQALEQRVEDRTSELEAANKQLLELDALKTKFIDDVSHEMRTPAANIRLYLDLLRKRKGNPERHQHYINVIDEQTQRLNHLIDQVLDFSSFDRGRTTPEIAAVNLNELVEKGVEVCGGVAAKHSLKLTLDLDPTIPHVIGVAQQLELAVKHLISNALKYTPEGEIAIITCQDAAENQVVLEVKDTGMGISQEEMPYIFDQFYRGQRVSQLTFPGTGLGLALVKETIEQHHGRIELTSEENVGTTFRIFLPTAAVKSVANNHL